MDRNEARNFLGAVAAGYVDKKDPLISEARRILHMQQSHERWTESYFRLNGGLRLSSLAIEKDISLLPSSE